MMFRISFDTTDESTSGNLLLHLAVVLHQLRVAPERLVWTELDGGGEVRLWMVVAQEGARLQRLVDALGATTWIRAIKIKPETGP